MDLEPSPGSDYSRQSLRAHDDPERAECFLALAHAWIAAGVPIIIQIQVDRGQTIRPARIGELLVAPYLGGELAVESVPVYGARMEIALPHEVYG